MYALTSSKCGTLFTVLSSEIEMEGSEFSQSTPRLCCHLFKLYSNKIRGPNNSFGTILSKCWEVVNFRHSTSIE